MAKLSNIKPPRVFYYFEKLSAIPRGSGNMKAISEYCENFARENNLRYIRDNADNVIIFKDGSVGYEKSEPVILQGHLDMVCQKTEYSCHDFEKDGLDLYIDGDYIKADGTTLGADNGIAVAMILAILESDEYLHPPIEAVFTVDEEVGMLGAMALDMSVLKARRMINLDSEEEGVVTVSCAGGSDFTVRVPLNREPKNGTEVTVFLKGLKGGHSGIEINSGRVNADLLLGRILDSVGSKCGFGIISLNGGDKANAIPNRAAASVCVSDSETFVAELEAVLGEIKKEITHREPDFEWEIIVGANGEHRVFENSVKDKLISALLYVPNGVVQMSAEIEGLVETSLNIGIMKTDLDNLTLGFALRSNKKSAQAFLVRRMEVIFDLLGFPYEKSGYYPPWEFKDNSSLQALFSDVYTEHCGKEPEIAAIHAGLECGVFASAIDGLECISIGPEMSGVHTTEEELSISSTNRLFEILTEILKRLK